LKEPERGGARRRVRNTLLPEELPHARAVDAALVRRPTRSARALSLGVIAFFGTVILWAAYAEVDEVTHAEGQVVASQRTQTIQNLEGGILSGLLVREGQIVEQGDVLARLDNEFAASSYRDAVSKALEHHAAILRLEAELRRADPVFPTDASAWLASAMGAPPNVDIAAQAGQVFADQRAAYAARVQQKTAEILLLKAQHAQRLHDIEEQLARTRLLAGQLGIALEQRGIVAPLVERGSYSRVDYLNLQNQVISLQGEIETLQAALPKARAAADEAEQRMAFREAELDAAIVDEINRRRSELASLRETLSAGGDRVVRTELRSPVRGTVRQVYITTLGGVVRPGESIMDIVPLDDTLLVEARIRPSDVAFLRPGQRAVVKISAYDFSVYGGLEGKLEQISADTIEDRRGELFYQVRVRTESTAILHKGEELPIIPGMVATVDIMIGKKSILDYILKPIFKARQNALREK
jgi:adhesin transport system membrane fusion protein